MKIQFSKGEMAWRSSKSSKRSSRAALDNLHPILFYLLQVHQEDLVFKWSTLQMCLHRWRELGQMIEAKKSSRSKLDLG